MSAVNNGGGDRAETNGYDMGEIGFPYIFEYGQVHYISGNCPVQSESRYGDKPYAAGYMPQNHALAPIEQCAREFVDNGLDV